ncbi:sugar O-acyltransferase [Kordiimonas sp.]|uniref:PglD-related sugar-binding protein n=1 Tax=Kordiimonas sp. TaxID=1970157 RepID=UPI003A8E0FBB
MKIGIFGSAGFACEVADICDALGYTDIVFVNDYEAQKTVSGIDVLPLKNVPRLEREGYVFAIGIGDPQVRKKISTKYSHLAFPNLIHPSATFGRKQLTRLQETRGNIFAAGVRLTTGIQIGNFCIFNINTVIGHNCIVRNYVSIMSGCLVSGNVSIGEASYLGSGAKVTQGQNHRRLSIGKEAFVGIGSVVLRSIRDGQKVFGNPAQKIF